MKKVILAIMATTILGCTKSDKLTCLYEADKKAIVCTKGNLECVVEKGKAMCEPVPVASPSVSASPSPSVSPSGVAQ